MPNIKNLIIPYVIGGNADLDARVTFFFTVNHMDHESSPDNVTSSEQVRFSVYLEENEIYIPCSEKMFKMILSIEPENELDDIYNEILKKVEDIIKQYINEGWRLEYLLEILRLKFSHDTYHHIALPSRLEKKLIKIFLDKTGINDPCTLIKASWNRRMDTIVSSLVFQKALLSINEGDIKEKGADICYLRYRINLIELKRTMALLAYSELWEKTSPDKKTGDTLQEQMTSVNFTGDGLDSLIAAIGLINFCGPQNAETKTILWITDNAGGFIIDLRIIYFLTRFGHRVIISVKDGFHFYKITWDDIIEDKTLSAYLNDADFIESLSIEKNELLARLKSDKKLHIINDGTSENINMLKTSLTFARAFKESDLIISRGQEQFRRFFQTKHQFTRDIINITSTQTGNLQIKYKPKHPDAKRFSHQDLEDRAMNIVNIMEDARNNNKKIMFYSGVVGSIPGQVNVARELMTIFINHLHYKNPSLFIINPSEHYAPGMDADDLMYMWEIVQKSGLIDIWRFQTYEDIEKSFELLNEKVPLEWLGKDATFSTGCTKEIAIAQKVQKKNREMQIIGPPIEKFRRRKEYGVGKMYDKVFSN